MLSQGYDELRIAALIPQHPTMRKIRAQVWGAGATNFHSKRHCFHLLKGGISGVSYVWYQIVEALIISQPLTLMVHLLIEILYEKCWAELLLKKKMFHLHCKCSGNALSFSRQISWATLGLISKLAIWETAPGAHGIPYLHSQTCSFQIPFVDFLLWGGISQPQQ